MKNVKNSGRDQNESSQIDLENLDFIKETIKQKPMDRKQLTMRIAAVLGGAVLFGAVSSFVIAGLTPGLYEKFFQKEEVPKVDIPTDDPIPEKEEVTPEETPQVVEIPKEITLKDYDSFFQKVLQVAEKPRNAIVTVSGVSQEQDLLDHSFLRSGQASGVLIADNGKEMFILTGEQATKKAEHIQVVFGENAVVEAEVKKSDPATGLTVISVQKEALPEEIRSSVTIATLGNSYGLIQGKPVIAIGSPTGYNDSVSYGNITSVTNKITLADAEYNLLVTDILGSSEGSGVLLDTEGSVIGIIAQQYGDKEEKTSVKALSVSQLKPLIENLSNGEDIIYMGVHGQDVTETISDNTGIPQGVYIDSIESDSPAMEAGMQPADVIVRLGEEKIPTVQRYSTVLQKCKKDQKIPVVIMRRGTEGYEEMTFEITLSAR